MYAEKRPSRLSTELSKDPGPGVGGGGGGYGSQMLQHDARASGSIRSRRSSDASGLGLDASGLGLSLDIFYAETWVEEEVAEWVTSRGFAPEAALFLLQKDIDGKILLKMSEDDLKTLGVSSVGRRLLLWEEMQSLRRLSGKEETRQLTNISYLRALFEMFSFGWANTSENKTGDDLKAEIIASNNSIAVVASLVFAICWGFFFTAADECFCGSNTAVRDTSLPEGEWRDTLCYCRQGYDIRYKVPMSMFFCFSAMSSMMYLWCLMLAVFINIAVNETNDEQEAQELIENVLGSWLSWPGTYLTVGTVFSIVPITVFEIFNHDFGLYAMFHRTQVETSDADLATKVICVTVMVMLNGIVAYGFLVAIPGMIRKVYQAKVKATWNEVSRNVLHKKPVPCVQSEIASHPYLDAKQYAMKLKDEAQADGAHSTRHLELPLQLRPPQSEHYPHLERQDHREMSVDPPARRLLPAHLATATASIYVVPPGASAAPAYVWGGAANPKPTYPDGLSYGVG